MTIVNTKSNWIRKEHNSFTIVPILKVAGIILLLTASIQILLPREIWYYKLSVTFGVFRANIETIGYGLASILLMSYYWRNYRRLCTVTLSKLIAVVFIWGLVMLVIGYISANQPKAMAFDLLVIVSFLIFPLALDKKNLVFIDKGIILLSLILMIRALQIWLWKGIITREVYFESGLNIIATPLVMVGLYLLGTLPYRGSLVKVYSFFVITIASIVLIFSQIRGTILAALIVLLLSVNRKAILKCLYILIYLFIILLLWNGLISSNPLLLKAYEYVDIQVSRQTTLWTRIDEATSLVGELSVLEWVLGRGIGGTFYPILDVRQEWWNEYGATYLHLNFLTLILKGGIVFLIMVLVLIFYPFMVSGKVSDLRILSARSVVLFFAISNLVDPLARTSLNVAFFALFWGIIVILPKMKR